MSENEATLLHFRAKPQEGIKSFMPLLGAGIEFYVPLWNENHVFGDHELVIMKVRDMLWNNLTAEHVRTITVKELCEEEKVKKDSEDFGK